MDVRKVVAILRCLEIGPVRAPVRDLLSEAARAGQARDLQLMYDLAETTRRLSLIRCDQLAEAAALVYLTVSAAGLGRGLSAWQAIEKARRIYHLDPASSSRLNEGITAYLSGLVAARLNSDGAAAFGLAPIPTSVEAIQSCELALVLLEEARRDFSAHGDRFMCRRIDGLSAHVRRAIRSRIPILFVDGPAESRPALDPALPELTPVLAAADGAANPALLAEGYADPGAAAAAGLFKGSRGMALDPFWRDDDGAVTISGRKSRQGR